MSNTYLTVPYKEKDSAKALGARFDGERRQWYVPDGQDVTLFDKWLSTAQPQLSSASRSVLDSSATTDVQVPVRGVSLSRLLAGVSHAVAQAYSSGVWTTVEVLRVSGSPRDGHVYLELSERDAGGQVVAKAQAAIWAKTAQRIIPDFEKATGATLGPGIKLLVRALPVFKALYGFSLDIDAIDPMYTLGDLEAKKREIRERLKREGLFERNKRLAAPWDYQLVLVVAPQGAAGLGDFANEAARLERRGICRFVYFHSRFQGPGAAAEVLQALVDGVHELGKATPDAVIIIRGGGAVNDLAWLNDYDLARFVCECAVPVLTGIGHERDNTVLDEVANQRFDTPSKVIAGIEQQIVRRSAAAKENFNAVVGNATRMNERARAATDRLEQQVQASARTTVVDARSRARQVLGELRIEAVQTVHRATADVTACISSIRSDANQHLGAAKHGVPATMRAIKDGAASSLKAVRLQLYSAVPRVLERAALDTKTALHAVSASLDTVADRAQQTVAVARTSSQALVREITGQGPQKTLGRGFAMVRTAEGRTLASAVGSADARSIEVVFSDGKLDATVNRVDVSKPRTSNTEFESNKD